ncbi:MAG: hypothetical protein LBF22_02270 [Deltaproteobacteria bacterium]|nr:hypothetical protein [Deltaproteobacteria bacterium]
MLIKFVKLKTLALALSLGSGVWLCVWRLAMRLSLGSGVWLGYCMISKYSLFLKIIQGLKKNNRRLERQFLKQQFPKKNARAGFQGKTVPQII